MSVKDRCPFSPVVVPRARESRGGPFRAPEPGPHRVHQQRGTAPSFLPRSHLQGQVALASLTAGGLRARAAAASRYRYTDSAMLFRWRPVPVIFRCAGAK
jgi:hypothetical protein